MENTIKFNIHLSKHNVGQSQNRDETNTGAVSSPLSPNTGLFGSSATGAIASSAVLVATLIGAFLAFRLFHRKRYRRVTLPKVLVITMLFSLAIGGSFSLVKALEKIINLDANILSTENCVYQRYNYYS